MIRRIKSQIDHMWHEGKARLAPTKRILLRAGYLVPLLLILMFAGTALAQDIVTASDDVRERILTLADTRPVAQIILFALIATSLYTGGLLSWSLRQRYAITWRASRRLAGWVVPLITVLVVIVFVLGNEKDARFNPLVSVPFIQLIIPIAAAIHTALIFSPEDEPLEVLLALPRPITWLVFERVLIVILIHAGIGVMGMGLMAAKGNLVDAGALLAAWVPAMLFLVSFALYLTVRTRVMLMGLVGALVVWFIFMLFNPFLMPGMPQPFPFNFVQPLLWMINIFVQPSMFPEVEYYTLNRLILLGLTVFLFGRTVGQLNDGETLLLTLQDRQMRRRPALAVETSRTKRPLKLHPTPVALSTLWQIAAMWLYEPKLHWRRRPLKVVFITLVAVVGIVLLISYEAFTKLMLQGVPIEQLAYDQQMIIKGLAFTRMPLAMLTVMHMLVMPVLFADSVAIDQNDNMDEMLHSTPLPGWAYLVGKIGGMWWASMSALALALTILSGIWFVSVGPYDVFPALDSWLLLSAPVLLFNGGFAVLIGATQPNRRRAVIAVIGAFFLSFYLGNRFTDGVLNVFHLSPYNTSLLINAFGSNNTLPITYSSLFTLDKMPEFMVGRGLVFAITAIVVGLWWLWRWSGVSLRPKTTSSPAPLPVQQGS